MFNLYFYKRSIKSKINHPIHIISRLGVSNNIWTFKMLLFGEDVLVLSVDIVDGDCWELENKISKKLKKLF